MDDMSLWENMTTGFLSSGIASFITTPMDVVKTRMMLSASEQNHVKLSFFQMFKKVYRVGSDQISIPLSLGRRISRALFRCSDTCHIGIYSGSCVFRCV